MRMSPVSTNTRLRRRDDSIATEIDGEAVVMSLATGRTYGLDKRGSRIWALLEQPATVDALVQKLLEQYDTTAESCRVDVIAFAEKLLALGLVTCDETSS